MYRSVTINFNQMGELKWDFRKEFIYAPLHSTDFTALIFKKPIITQYF